MGIRAMRLLQSTLGEADADLTGVRLVMTLLATWMTVTLFVVIGSLVLIALLALVWTLHDLD